ACRGPACREPGCVVGCSWAFLQGDVVDQAGLADANSGGEHWWVERRHRDVVDSEPRVLEDRAGGLGVAGGERAGKGERTGPLLGGEPRVPGREREPVRVADGGEGCELELEVEVGDHPPEHRDLLRVLLAEV